MGYLNEDGLTTLVGKIKGQVVQLTSAEYRLLPESKNSDNKIYFVTDEDYAYAIDDEPTLNSDNLVKSGGVYNYTSKIGSGTLTTTAQTIIPAINELKSGLTVQTYSGVPSSGVSFGSRNVLKKFGNVYYFSMVISISRTISSGSTIFTVPVNVGSGYLMTSVDSGNDMVLTLNGSEVKTDFAITTGTVLRIGCSVIGN